MQKWLMSNLTGLVAGVALTFALATGLFVTVAQVRCTLLEEDVARLKGRMKEEVESLRDEQETNHKAVLAIVNQTVRRAAAQPQEAREEPDTPEDKPAKDEPEGGFQ